MEKIFVRTKQGAGVGGILGAAIGTLIAAGAIGTLVGGGVGAASGTVETINDKKKH